MNVSCRNRGVARGDRNLVEIRDDVSRRIDSVDRRTLVSIDFKTSHMICPGAQFGRELRSYLAAERRVDDVERQCLIAAQKRADFVSVAFDRPDRSRSLYSRAAKQARCFPVFLRAIVQA